MCVLVEGSLIFALIYIVKVLFSLQNKPVLTECGTTRAQLPVVSRDSFLEVMEVVLRGLIIVCLLWKRVVVEAAPG